MVCYYQGYCVIVVCMGQFVSMAAITFKDVQLVSGLLLNLSLNKVKLEHKSVIEVM